jgi:CheY-like chemotaxis protein
MPKKKILIVEDNPGDLLLLQHAMKYIKVRCEFQVFRDGQDAMNYIIQPSKDKPELILLDLNLPRYSGWDLLEAIKKQPALGGVCVMILSTSDSPSEMEKARREGVLYFKKALDFEGYIDTAHEIIERSEPPDCFLMN